MTYLSFVQNNINIIKWEDAHFKVLPVKRLETHILWHTILSSSNFGHCLWFAKKSQWMYLQVLLFIFNFIFFFLQKCDNSSNIILSQKISTVPLFFFFFSFPNYIFVFLYSCVSLIPLQLKYLNHLVHQKMMEE